MDYKKIEAGECTEENGNSSEEREESSIRSNSLTSSVSGDKNIVLSNCNVSFNIQENKELTPSTSLGQAGSSKAGNVVKHPTRRAPIQKEDKALPRKKKRAGSDKPSDKGRKMSEETLPGTSGSAGKSGRGKKSSGKTKTSDTDKENKPKVKQPKKRAPLRKGDKAPPRKKKRATSDTDKENKPKDNELTPSPSLGQAGSSKAGTVGQCSNLSTVFENVGKTSKLIRVVIYDVEVESRYRKDTKKWLPGTFRVMDPSGWGYITVFGKAKGKQFKQGQSIDVSNVKAKNKEELTCNADSVKSSSEPVQIPDCDVNKMKQEEKFTTLREIREGEFKKTKVIICEVGEQMSRGKLYFRELKVKASRTAQDIETLVAFNLPAKFKYKAGQEVKIPCVKYNDVKNQFQTVGDCVVKKLRDL